LLKAFREGVRSRPSPLSQHIIFAVAGDVATCLPQNEAKKGSKKRAKQKKETPKNGQKAGQAAFKKLFQRRGSKRQLLE
jgi:hypothetical protein